nr:hypothetical protein [Tanacetum cinerariifolium]
LPAARLLLGKVEEGSGGVGEWWRWVVEWERGGDRVGGKTGRWCYNTNASFASAIGSLDSIYRPEWAVPNGSMLDTPEACQDLAIQRELSPAGGDGVTSTPEVRARGKAAKEVATLQEHVSGEEKLKAAFEEFKRYEDSRVEQRSQVGDRRHGVEHGQAQLSLESIEAYDPEAEAKYVAALQALKDLKYPLVDQLEGLKDAPMDVIMAALYLESDTGDDAPQHIRDLRPSSSQLTILVYPEVRDPMNPWACKEEMSLTDAITANISRVEKKKKCRLVCRTHGVGSAHHARSDGVLCFVCPMGVFTPTQRLGHSLKDTESVAARVANRLCSGPCTKIHGS